MTQDRAQGFLAAAALLDVGDERATWVAGRSTLCAGPDDLARYDAVFEAFFNARDGLPRPRPATPPTPHASQLPDTERSARASVDDAETVLASASETEVLRHRDVASLSAAEKHRLAAMFATIHPRPPMRRTARHQRWHRGQVDAHRTLAHQPAPDGRAGADQLAAPRQQTAPRGVVGGRVRIDERRTPTRCCGSRTG